MDICLLWIQGSQVRSQPGPILRGDWSWNNLYGHSPPFHWNIQEGLRKHVNKVLVKRLLRLVQENVRPSRNDHSCWLGHKAKRLGIDAQKLQVHHVRSALLACPISPPSSVSESLSNSSSSEYSGSHIYPAYPKLSFSSPEAIITQWNNWMES